MKLKLEKGIIDGEKKLCENWTPKNDWSLYWEWKSISVLESIDFEWINENLERNNGNQWTIKFGTYFIKKHKLGYWHGVIWIHGESMELSIIEWSYWEDANLIVESMKLTL